MGRGTNTDQAGAIVAVLTTAPPSATPAVRRQALHQLIDYAADYDADTLRRLGIAIWAAVDPDAADVDAERRLRAQERRACARRSFTGADDGEASVLPCYPPTNQRSDRTDDYSE